MRKRHLWARWVLHNAGQASVTECALEITLTQGSEQITLWEGVDLPQPLQPGTSVATPDISFSSPFTGRVEVSMQVHAPDGSPTGVPMDLRNVDFGNRRDDSADVVGRL